MKANELKVNSFLSSVKTQFVIPVYQRNYDWGVAQCRQLFEDILEVGNNDNANAHFIGSIVFIHDDTYTTSRIKELTIIDGQQRLTTITLIYIALYKFSQKMQYNDLVDEINETYLINKFADSENLKLSNAEKLKLRPTENNNKALKFLLRSESNEEFGDFSRIIDNFKYFKERIKAENYKTVLTGLSKLMFVEISLERGKDDPQRIFESLNSTGLKLEQGDLIRNYILMGLKPEYQTKIYHSYWELIEQLAKDNDSYESKVSDFIRDYLTLKNKSIPNKGKVYLEFKEKYPITTLELLEQNLAEIKGLAQHYNKLINPQNETDKAIKLQLESIKKLEINVSYPFLMQVYDDYNNNVIDKKTFIDILSLIQSFIWRRFIVGLPTNALNKIFMGLYYHKDFDNTNYLISIQKILLTLYGNSRFPRDKEFIDCLKIKDVYNINSKNRVYLLERLENFENKEPVLIDETITIEHIFPQNPDPQWKTEIGNEECDFIKQNYLNTIANLTLSGNNTKLGNKPFLEKKDLPNAGYKDSRLWLNKYLASLNKWNKTEIEKRFNHIAERVLKIWNIPNINFTEQLDTNIISIFEADDPTHKKLEYAIFLDQRINVTEVAKLYTEVLKKLFELQPDRFFSTELTNKIGLPQTSQDNLRTAAKLNDSYYIETGFSNIEKFKKIKLALTFFELQDELMIKYAETPPQLPF